MLDAVQWEWTWEWRNAADTTRSHILRRRICGVCSQAQSKVYTTERVAAGRREGGTWVALARDKAVRARAREAAASTAAGSRGGGGGGGMACNMSPKNAWVARRQAPARAPPTTPVPAAPKPLSALSPQQRRPSARPRTGPALACRPRTQPG
jgi:hypothetical protein